MSVLSTLAMLGIFPFLIPAIPYIMKSSGSDFEQIYQILVGLAAAMMVLLALAHVTGGSPQAKKMAVVIALFIMLVINPLHEFTVVIGDSSVTIPASLIDASMAVGLLCFVELSRTLNAFKGFVFEYARNSPETAQNFAMLLFAIRRYTSFITKKIAISALLAFGFAALMELLISLGMLLEYKFVRIIPLIYVVAFAMYHALSGLDKGKRDDLEVALAAR